VDAFHRLPDGTVIAAHESGDDRQVLRLGLLAGSQHGANSGGIHGDRLFGKDVFARLDARFQMGRPEVRRRGQQHDIHVGLDQLRVGVEPGKAMIGIHGDAVCHFGFLEDFQGVLHVVRERIGQGHQLGVGIGRKGLDGRASSASVTAGRPSGFRLWQPRERIGRYARSAAAPRPRRPRWTP
jgi:hypothetical protein